MANFNKIPNRIERIGDADRKTATTNASVSDEIADSAQLLQEKMPACITPLYMKPRTCTSCNIAKKTKNKCTLDEQMELAALIKTDNKTKQKPAVATKAEINMKQYLLEHAGGNILQERKRFTRNQYRYYLSWPKMPTYTNDDDQSDNEWFHGDVLETTPSKTLNLGPDSLACRIYQ